MVCVHVVCVLCVCVGGKKDGWKLSVACKLLLEGMVIVIYVNTVGGVVHV